MREEHQSMNLSNPSANQNGERKRPSKRLKIEIYFVPLTSKKVYQISKADYQIGDWIMAPDWMSVPTNQRVGKIWKPSRDLPEMSDFGLVYRRTTSCHNQSMGTNLKTCLINGWPSHMIWLIWWVISYLCSIVSKAEKYGSGKLNKALITNIKLIINRSLRGRLSKINWVLRDVIMRQ